MRGSLNDAPIVSASLMLANRGIFGLIWLDPELTVTGIYGPLVQDVQVGEPLTDSYPFLSGYEGELTDVAEDRKSAFTLPSVSVITAGEQGPRITISAFRNDEGAGFIVLVTRELSRSSTELELSRQMRARLMAEEAEALKSRELKIANAELELANRDLEDYAAVISHDLKAPLRAMRYLSEDIEKSISDGDAAKAQAELERLRAQSRRMSSMLSALLDYASVGRKADVIETTDTNALVQSILDTMPRPEGFTLQATGTWPTFKTLAAPLDVVLRNLIDNAIKHHDRDDGSIRVNGLTEPDTFIITVTDDGPGISAAYRDAVFEPFRTLQSEDARNSSGMGLAFARRTAETAGGRLELMEGADGERGATFRLTWPKRTDGDQAAEWPSSS